MTFRTKEKPGPLDADPADVYYRDLSKNAAVPLT